MAITASGRGPGSAGFSQQGLVGAFFGAGAAVEVPLTQPELVVPCCSAPAGSRPGGWL